MVIVIIHDEGFASGALGLYLLNDGVVAQFDGFNPSCNPLLIARISGGAERVAVIVSLRHQVPCLHAIALAVCRVIQVGEAKAVGKLVADGADTACAAV